ncbi:MAG TPA: hypothetical protein PKE47_11635, partial [Verrucomicrobiota bacterium]|nr:hypothetical protein [Verrucomicrobiota bacterium]
MSHPGVPHGFRSFTLRGAAITLAVATAVALLLASQLVLFTSSINRPIPWGTALASGFRDTLLWAALLPLIFWLTARFPLTGRRWLTSLPAHVAGIAVVVLLYANLHTLVTQVLWADILEPARWPFGRGGGGPPGGR